MAKEKTMSLIDMIGMALSAFVSMELISSQATLGPSIVISFLVIGGIYLITHCALCAELGGAYPDQGGIYSWVKRGLGDTWAARTNWWYWLNVVGFVPSVMIPMVSVFQQLFWPDMPFAVLIALCIAGTWLIAVMTMMPLKSSKLLNNAGTAAKIIFCVALIAGGAYVLLNGGSQVVFSPETMMPTFDLALAALIPTFAYGLTGMDAIATAAEEMKDPRHDMPKAMIVSAIIAMALYIFSIVAVEVILPQGGIDDTSGLIDAVMAVYGNGGIAVVLMGIALALLYFSNAFAWPLAASKAAQEAAEEGEFPRVFAISNKYGSPVGGAVVLAAASTALILLYALIASSNENLFWTILAFTGVIFLLPYIAMTISYIKLRREDQETERTIAIPGKTLPFVAAGIHLAMLAFSCVFFMLPPEGEGMTYMVILIGTIVGTQIIGEVIIARSAKRKAASTHC